MKQLPHRLVYVEVTHPVARLAEPMTNHHLRELAIAEGEATPDQLRETLGGTHAGADVEGLFEVGEDYFVVLRMRAPGVVGVDVRLRRSPRHPEATITTTEPVRRLPLKAMEADLRRAWAEYLRDPEGFRGEDPKGELEGFRQSYLHALNALPREPGRRGPRGYDPTHYESVAEVHRLATDAGKPPVRAVERHFHVSRSTASRWVAACREMGLLGRSEQR